MLPAQYQHSWHPSGTDIWHRWDWKNYTGNCASWNVQVISYNIDLIKTILQNHVLHFLTNFLWRCFHWPTWTWIFFNRFPTPLKLLGPILYLVVGRLNIIIYSIHHFMAFSWLLPFLCEEFYNGMKLQTLFRFIVGPHTIALAILLLPLMSEWFVNMAATCQDMPQPACVRSHMV